MENIEFKAVVRWQDGTYDGARTCSECGLDTCKYPVHLERYRVISTPKARAFDATSFNVDETSLEI